MGMCMSTPPTQQHYNLNEKSRILQYCRGDKVIGAKKICVQSWKWIGHWLRGAEMMLIWCNVCDRENYLFIVGGYSLWQVASRYLINLLCWCISHQPSILCPRGAERAYELLVTVCPHSTGIPYKIRLQNLMIFEVKPLLIREAYCIHDVSNVYC